MHVLLNPASFIDKTYPTGTEVQELTREEWIAGDGKPPSLHMQAILDAGDAFMFKFPDGRFRYLMQSEVGEEIVEESDSGFDAFCQEQCEL